MTTIQGDCDASFAKLKNLFHENLKSGEELGASICININGKNVVDIWGGFADQDGAKPWTKDTLVAV